MKMRKWGLFAGLDFVENDKYFVTCIVEREAKESK